MPPGLPPSNNAAWYHAAELGVHKQHPTEPIRDGAEGQGLLDFALDPSPYQKVRSTSCDARFYRTQWKDPKRHP